MENTEETQTNEKTSKLYKGSEVDINELCKLYPAAFLRLEGFKPNPYKDGVINGKQMYSIGYGHQILSDEQYLMKGNITMAKADELFYSDFKKVGSHPRSLIKFLKDTPLTIKQWLSLCSLVLNVGYGGALPQLRLIKAGKISDFIKNHPNYYVTMKENNKDVKKTFLVKRREQELDYFTNEGKNYA